jgi:hypothetical protein
MGSMTPALAEPHAIAAINPAAAATALKPRMPIPQSDFYNRYILLR